jgi:DNA-binding beta-propeller fold protein YncE
MPLHRWLLGAACLSLVAVTGCKDEKTPTQLGNGTIGTLKPAAHDETAFTAPLDATPSSDGSAVYFTARNADGAGVFKADASGSGATALAVGDPIAGPVGLSVSSDDQMLYVADPGAVVGEQDEGVIWTVPTGGGTPEAVSGTAGYIPRGVVVVKLAFVDHLFFTGTDPSDGQPGVFRVSPSGGTVDVIAKGEPFSDPHGIAVTQKGDVYVVDSASKDPNSSSARVIAVSNKSASVLMEGLAVGFPAGIALSQDEASVLVSALDPAKGTDQVVRINIASKEMSSYSDNISSFQESAGLHRAAKAEVYAWADSAADGSGTVYLLSP